MNTDTLPDWASSAEFVSAKTIARDLGVHDVTVRQWIVDGRLPVVRFSNRRVAVPITSYLNFRKTWSHPKTGPRSQPAGVA